jgi:ribokinase
LTVPRITVVGSYATGLTMKVERMPSTGETLLGTGYRVDYGGKGSNQAVGCARLGAHVSFVARIGTDPFGEMALGLYRDEGIDITYVQHTANAPTGVGFIIVEAASGHNCITIDPGATPMLPIVKLLSIRRLWCSLSLRFRQPLLRPHWRTDANKVQSRF